MATAAGQVVLYSKHDDIWCPNFVIQNSVQWKERPGVMMKKLKKKLMQWKLSMLVSLPRTSDLQPYTTDFHQQPHHTEPQTRLKSREHFDYSYDILAGKPARQVEDSKETVK